MNSASFFTALERLVEILQIHDATDSKVSIYQLPSDTEDYLPLLKQVKTLTENRIIIDCKPEKVMSLLRQAILVGMLDDYRVCLLLLFFFSNLKYFD